MLNGKGEHRLLITRLKVISLECITIVGNVCIMFVQHRAVPSPKKNPLLNLWGLFVKAGCQPVLHLACYCREVLLIPQF
jgi:hypothetical protein